jgi:hypothetical protein
MSDRQPGHFPFWEPVFKAARSIAALTQRRDGLERQDAPRTTTVGNNFPISR